MDKSDRTVIIFNIPTSFGGSDLRRCFTTFTETEKFECFHYKRRPEAKLPGFRRDLFLHEESENTPSDKNLAVAVLKKYEFVQPFIGKQCLLLPTFLLRVGNDTDAVQFLLTYYILTYIILTLKSLIEEQTGINEQAWKKSATLLAYY